MKAIIDLVSYVLWPTYAAVAAVLWLLATQEDFGLLAGSRWIREEYLSRQ